MPNLLIELDERTTRSQQVRFEAAYKAFKATAIEWRTFNKDAFGKYTDDKIQLAFDMWLLCYQKLAASVAPDLEPIDHLFGGLIHDVLEGYKGTSEDLQAAIASLRLNIRCLALSVRVPLADMKDLQIRMQRAIDLAYDDACNGWARWAKANASCRITEGQLEAANRRIVELEAELRSKQ